jgi:putative polyhydroxyalkanoate system protein
MSNIQISRVHGTTVKRAKEAVEAIAGELAQEFDISYEWDGSALNFERAGVQGTMTVGKKTLDVEVELGLLVSMLKPRIEREIHRFCDEQFGPES